MPTGTLTGSERLKAVLANCPELSSPPGHVRNDMLRNLRAMPSAEGRPAHSALTLPDFSPMT